MHLFIKYLVTKMNSIFFSNAIQIENKEGHNVTTHISETGLVTFAGKVRILCAKVNDGKCSRVQIINAHCLIGSEKPHVETNLYFLNILR